MAADGAERASGRQELLLQIGEKAPSPLGSPHEQGRLLDEPAGTGAGEARLEPGKGQPRAALEIRRGEPFREPEGAQRIFEGQLFGRGACSR